MCYQWNEQMPDYGAVESVFLVLIRSIRLVRLVQAPIALPLSYQTPSIILLVAEQHSSQESISYVPA
jgi:hypothetical protein